MPPHQPRFQLAELFNHLEDVVAWIKDRSGRYQWVNRAFLIDYDGHDRLNGAEHSTDRTEVIGKTDFDLSPLFLAEQYRLDDEYVLAGNRLVNRIEQVGHPGGLAVWNVTNKIPLLDTEGVVIGTAGHTRKLVAPDRHDGFSAVLEHMRDHFDTPISNEELARLAHMSVRAFERKFLANFHLTPQKYLRKVQIRMASRALVYTDKLLSEVAASCGFADQSHFTREFRRQFGRTPGEYREYYARAESNAVPVPKAAARDQ